MSLARSEPKYNLIVFVIIKLGNIFNFHAKKHFTDFSRSVCLPMISWAGVKCGRKHRASCLSVSLRSDSLLASETTSSSFSEESRKKRFGRNILKTTGVPQDVLLKKSEIRKEDRLTKNLQKRKNKTKINRF